MSEKISWTHPRVLTAFLAVFLVGAAAGAMGMRMRYRGTTSPAARAMGQMDRKELVSFFNRELNLTDEQRKQVETMLDDQFKYLQTLGAQLEELRLHSRESIVKVLTPEQRKKFDKLMSEWQRAQR
jgi:Spy/CpxP family protein refolding chaperone